MPVIMSSRYLDRLCAARDYEGLVWISSVLCGCRTFHDADPAYGLPKPAFALVERLGWFAQGIRSGVWTYYEATPPERQRAMLASLHEDTTHADFADQYRFGMHEWRMQARWKMLDAWLDGNDDLNNQIAWQIVFENRELFQTLVNVDP